MNKNIVSLFVFLVFSFVLSCGSSTSTGTSTTYTVGGTISGLVGTVVLQNNSGDDLSVTANGTFTFAAKLADAATYSVSVLTEPTNQTCTVSSGSGTVSSANVTSVTAACVDTNPRIFITASAFAGNFGGITTADSSCMSDANYPGAGTYKALISDGTTRVACTTANCDSSQGTDWVMAANTRYVRSDGTTTISSTNTGGIFRYDLTNPLSAASGSAWTGLSSDWTSVADGDNCAKWVSATVMGRKGAVTDVTTKYLDDGNQSCSSTAYLICVEQL